ncbi:hypothetical protein IW261DRAFT_1425657 [Armillaria novae-zelandiae]|uniref:Uncharacterized protein n=1 Tax=Armillaria novae-zelandiae TaxID=153914 RepID=A0AA39U509_9AGAR|nr:hypothetical protein IW261DRAFT_1425657 [Armillaria novae-zelandiae]
MSRAPTEVEEECPHSRRGFTAPSSCTATHTNLKSSTWSRCEFGLHSRDICKDLDAVRYIAGARCGSSWRGRFGTRSEWLILGRLRVVNTQRQTYLKRWLGKLVAAPLYLNIFIIGAKKRLPRETLIHESMFAIKREPSKKKRDQVATYLTNRELPFQPTFGLVNKALALVVDDEEGENFLVVVRHGPADYVANCAEVPVLDLFSPSVLDQWTIFRGCYGAQS